MPTVNNLSIQNALNGSLPCEGAKVLPYNADFAAAATYDFDLTQQWQQKSFSTVQGFYINNSANLSPVTVTVNGTGQTIVVPASKSGFFIMLMPSPPKLSINSAGGVTVYIAFLNFYVPPIVW